MASRFSVLVLSALFVSAVQGDMLNSADAQTCIDLCKKCKGVASLVDDQCECNIADNTSEGVECLTRMKREAEERGLDVMSCGLSSDQRSTRCTLGSKHAHHKHKHHRNYVDNVAKYFMNDGPITGSIFKAPPYAAQSKSSDCVEAPAPPADGIQSPQPPQVVLHSVPQTQHIILSTQPQHHQVILGSPPQNQFVSSANGDDCVGAAHIITQPQETLPSSTSPKCEEPSPQLSSSQVPDNSNGATIIHIVPNSNSPTVAAINPSNLQTGSNLTPQILHILTQHLTQPMLGIPQAIKAVSETPGINDLITVPGNFINTLMQRFGYRPSPPESREETPKESNIANEEPSSFKSDDSPPPATDNDDLNVSSPDPSSKDQSCITNPTPGSQLLGVMNPIVSAPPTAQVSYFHPMTQFSLPLIHGPIISSLSPYPNFVSNAPTSYIVGSPIGMPYFSNYNHGTPSMTLYNPVTNVQESPEVDTNPQVEQLNVQEYHTAAVPVVKQQKKICKKSSKEASVKMTRDVKAALEAVDKEINSKMKAEEFKFKTETAEKQVEQITPKVPKIERTTTQSPITEKSVEQNVRVERLTSEKFKSMKSIEKNKAEKLEKSKPIKEIIKKPKGEKKTV